MPDAEEGPLRHEEGGAASHEAFGVTASMLEMVHRVRADAIWRGTTPYPYVTIYFTTSALHTPSSPIPSPQPHPPLHPHSEPHWMPLGCTEAMWVALDPLGVVSCVVYLGAVQAATYPPRPDLTRIHPLLT